MFRYIYINTDKGTSAGTGAGTILYKSMVGKRENTNEPDNNIWVL